jgi:hypothetical protein
MQTDEPTRGKPWDIKASYNSYKEADEARNRLLEIFKDPQHKGMQVKINRRAGDRFVLKTRLHPDFEEKKEKGRGKNKRRNKKTAARRKPDTSSAI